MVLFRMNYAKTGRFYSGVVTTTQPGHRAMVFIVEDLLEEFAQTDEIHMDGTFHIVPNLFLQLATLTFFRFGKVSCNLIKF